jgi:hypothetical protein
VLPPTIIVGCGEIGPEVDTSRFGSKQGCGSHHETDSQHVLQFPAIDIPQVMGQHIAAVALYFVKRILQAIPTALDAD